MLAASVAALLTLFWATSAICALADPTFDEATVPVILLIVGMVPLVLGTLQMFLRSRASRWVLLVGFVLGMPMSFVAGAMLYQTIVFPIGVSLSVFGVLSAAGIFLSVVPPTVRYLDAVAPKQPGAGQAQQPFHQPQQYQQQQYQQQFPPQQPESYPPQSGSPPRQQWYPHR